MVLPPDEQAVDVYDNLMRSVIEYVHVGEFKRPQPQGPHGVI